MKLEELVNLHYREFSDTDKGICDYLMDNMQDIESISINDFAKESLSSKSSVIRFSQKLGFTGFGELKNFVRWQVDKHNHSDASYSFANQIITDAQETIDYLKNQSFEEIFEKMAVAEHIYVVATGTNQQTQAREFQRLLMLSNRDVRVITGSIAVAEFQRMAEMVSKKDVVFVLSLSGENIELEEVISIIKQRRASLISITNYHSNWLSKNCDFNLYSFSSRSPLPDDWWLRTTSTFFILIESFIFGYNDFLRKRDNK